jgi:hypothetical protein
VRKLFRIKFWRCNDNRFFIRWNKNKFFTKLEMPIDLQPITAESQSTTSFIIITIPLLVELFSEISIEIFLELIIEY